MVVRDNTVTGGSNVSLFGAGISVFQANVTVRNSTITGNSFSGDAGIQDGGGISFSYGTLMVENSAISGNSAHGGGGIRVSNGVATVRNSTVSGNSGSWLGGGVYISDGTLNVEFSTVAGNSAYTGGGVYAEGGATVLSAALLADNTCVTTDSNAKPDLGDPSGRVTATYTLIESASGHSFTDGANGNIVGVDPGLGPLADNGGFTWTHALATESAAIDQIPSGTIGCGSTVDTDQRGVSRPQGDACDIGAYETAALPTPDFTFNLSTLPAKTYGDAAFSVAGFASSTNSTGAITFALGASSAGCSVTSAGEVTITGAAVDPASCVITASLAADGTYAAAGPISQSFNIAKASTTVSINNVPSSATVGGTFTPTYTSLSDGTKSTTSSTTGVCTVSGGVVSYIATGTCTVVAHVAAGTNWLAADGAPQSFTVSSPSPITPNFTFNLPALSKTYGDGPFSVAGYTNSTNSTGAITFAVGSSSAGCSVTSAGQVTITGAAVGDAYCMIEASLAAAGVYTAAGPISQSFHIAKATPVQVVIQVLPLGAQVGGGFPATVETDGDGATSVTSSTLTVCTASGLDVSYIAAGTCTLVAHVAEGPNFTSADGGPQSFVVSPAAPIAPNFTFNLGTLSAKTYGDAPFSVAGPPYVSTNSTGAVTFALGAGSGCSVTSAGEVTITGAAVDPASCVITASLAADGTYAAAGPISQSFQIAKAALTVTAKNQTITYLDPTPTFGVGYSTFAGSEDSTALGGSLVYTFAGTGGTSYGSSTTPPTNAGTYSITPSGLTSANYSFSYVAGTFTINKAVPDLAFAPGTPSSGTVGGGFTPTVEADGDGATSVSSSTTGICTVNGTSGYVSYIAAGTCTLTAHVAEGSNYLAANAVPRDITVSPAAPITPDFTFDLSILPAKTYGDAPFSVAGYTSSNSTGAITFALDTSSTGCSVTGGMVTITGAAVDPSHCIIVASQAAVGGYTSAGPLSQSFNIAKASTTVSINNVPSSATVGGTFMPTYTSPSDGTKSTTSSTTGVCTVSGGVVSFDAAGTCTLVAHVAAGTEYLAADGNEQSFEVTGGGSPVFGSSCTYRAHPRSGQLQVKIAWENADPGVSLIQIQNGVSVTKELTPAATGTWSVNLRGEGGTVSYRLFGAESKKATPAPLMDMTVCTAEDSPVD